MRCLGLTPHGAGAAGAAQAPVTAPVVCGRPAGRHRRRPEDRDDLAGCDACAREAAALEAVVAHLAAAEAADPPAALRQRVLDRIATTGQEPLPRRGRPRRSGPRLDLGA
ncbi:hypothetical protein [Streptomyces sp. NPDC054765]